MGYWSSKVLPKIKKIFDKNGKKAAAAEACKAFDDAKDGYTKEFDEKKDDLNPKVLEIYEATSQEIKTLVKKPNNAGLKKHSPAVEKLLEELSKIDFPGSKPVHEACTKFGPTAVQGPILFVFEKVSTFIVTEEPKEAPPAAAAAAADATTTTSTEETSGGKDKEIVAEEETKEQVVVEAEAVPEKCEPTEPTPAKTEQVTPAEPPPKP